MPNLEENAVTTWLAEIRPVEAAGAWPPAIRAIEATSEARGLLEEFGRLLDDLEGADAGFLSRALRRHPLREDVRAVLAQIGAARALSVLHWLAERQIPDSHLIAGALTAGDTAEARALRAAIIAVTRRATLGRMFASQRVADLHSATQATSEENA
jgi:hypothetical protein